MDYRLDWTILMEVGLPFVNMCMHPFVYSLNANPT